MATKPTRPSAPHPGKPEAAPGRKPKRHALTREDGEIDGLGYKIGYARVSTLDQNLALQQDALKEAGCGKIFIEQMSGAVTDRPALRDALDYARSGDTLIVWKLDRLARSMRQLIETIEKSALARHRLSQPHGSYRHDDGARRLGVSHVQRACGV